MDDAIDRFDADNFWPTHPMDDGVEDGVTCIYFGAAGVIWALDYLKCCGAVSLGRDFTRILPMLLDRNIERFGKGIYPRHGSLLMDDLGVHLVAMCFEALHRLQAGRLLSELEDDDAAVDWESTPLWSAPNTKGGVKNGSRTGA